MNAAGGCAPRVSGMTALAAVADWLDEHLDGLLTEYGVPGAVVAADLGGEVVVRPAGVLSTRSGVPVTADSLFQIGSITKVWTATLVMQLVEEGKLDLDTPIREYLPEFGLADPAAAAAVTARQLLSHTAGFEGDVFTDTGRGDDCLQKYVETLHTDPQLFPPGEQFSYNNAGYCVLGRLVEVLRGDPFDACLSRRLFGPLGLEHAAASPYEAILHQVAVGHLPGENGAAPSPAPVWALARSNSPAGSVLAMRAADLLSFARMHRRAGQADSGQRLLAPEMVSAMQRRQVEVPELAMMGQAWGLGWELYRFGESEVFGHDGGTIGQAAFLRVVPARDLGLVLLTNGGDVIGLYRRVIGHLLSELAGLQLPPDPVPAPQSPPVGADRFVGEYACEVVRYQLSQDEAGRLWLAEIPQGVLAELAGRPPERVELLPYSDSTLISAEAQRGSHQLFAFLGDDGQGRARYLHTGRIVQRV